MYIDITGGTKTMSATAAMAGALIDVQLVYVASDDYLVDFRKSNPGSERLSFIDKFSQRGKFIPDKNPGTDFNAETVYPKRRNL